MKKILVLISFLPIVLSSCQGSCNCTRNLGCTIMSATGNLDGIVKEKKTYCFNSNYYPTKAKSDSVNSFYLRHSSDDSSVETRDSIYDTQTSKKIDKRYVQHYEIMDYTCVCPK